MFLKPVLIECPFLDEEPSVRLTTYIYIYIYIYRTAPLTSRFCILYIYSTTIRTEYFKHAAHSPFLPVQNAVYFIMLPFLVPVLFAFKIQVVLKFKRKFRRLKVNNDIYNVLVGGRHVSRIMDIRNCGAASCDWDAIRFELNIERKY